MKKRVGDIAIEVMKDDNSISIGYAWYGGLDEVFARCKKLGILKESGSRGGRRRPHPLNRQLTVLNCLDRDERFEKHLMRCTDGRAERLVRNFYLKNGVKK